jgi:hypothetical protein
VDDVELRPEAHSPLRGLLLEIEFAFGITALELGDLVFAQIRHDIDINGQPRLPIGDSGDRAR